MSLREDQIRLHALNIEKKAIIKRLEDAKIQHKSAKRLSDAAKRAKEKAFIEREEAREEMSTEYQLYSDNQPNNFEIARAYYIQTNDIFKQANAKFKQWNRARKDRFKECESIQKELKKQKRKITKLSQYIYSRCYK